MLPLLTTRYRGEGQGKLRKHLHRIRKGNSNLLRKPRHSCLKRLHLHQPRLFKPRTGRPIQHLMIGHTGSPPQQNLPTGKPQNTVRVNLTGFTLLFISPKRRIVVGYPSKTFLKSSGTHISTQCIVCFCFIPPMNEVILKI